MRAMVVRRYGPPEVFEARQVRRSAAQAGRSADPGEGGGRQFCGLAPAHGSLSGNAEAAVRPGLEIAGVVEKVAEARGKAGSEGEPLSRGDAVAALTAFQCLCGMGCRAGAERRTACRRA